ncbi:polysialyltransferase family glycosyltransferase [Brevibacterium litoralis]|uniref:polysialyltransferase family glycosyltransferase n=1 Tax=Brevibacterium litoralis TaxID=3138935 RepID=UPI0032EF4F5F
MTQLVFASTFYQAVSVAAMIDAGMVGTEGERRILLTSNNALVPELAPSIPDMLGAERVLSRFDEVYSWNDLIEPHHPKDYSFGISYQPVHHRYVSRELGLAADEPVELWLESLPFAPAGTIATLFPHAPITVHSDGLMTYGPTRKRLPMNVAQRLRGLVHTDLVPGLEPLLFSEESPARTALDPAHMRGVFAELVPLISADMEDRGLTPAPGTAVVLGQYLANLGLIDHAEEAALHAEMVDAAADRGCTRVVFKPHPTSHKQTTASMATRAAERGVEFHLADVPVSAEVVFEYLSPDLVVSCFSTGLATADAMYGIPAVAVGTEGLLKALAPYENSNRVPAVIADYLWSDSGSTNTEELQSLLGAVAYCMQAEILADHRPAAASFLDGQSLETIVRYFKRKRLTALELPGALPPRERRRVDPVRRVYRFARKKVREATGY